MKCTSDGSAQILTDKRDNPIERAVPVFLRYPHEQRDKIDSYARDRASEDAQTYVADYNETHDQEVDYVDVRITKITGKSDTDCSEDGTCHWEFRGEATYQILIECS